MVVGKTHDNASLTDILSKYSELDILSSYFDIKEMPCLINSPLREDRNPSFSLYLDRNQRVRYIDFATNEHGGLMDLLCQWWHCSFTQAVSKVYSDIIVTSSVKVSPRKAKSFSRQERNRMSRIEVKVRDWEYYDYEYWYSYGVDPVWLSYAEVYPISHKIVTKKDVDSDTTSRMVFKADKYAYVFVEHKERHTQLKIYQPYNTNGYKWCSKMDGSVISLWTKVPESGDRIVICSSLKDALCISCQLSVPAIALQGEGYDMSDTAIGELKRRFANVYIAFDMDKAGIEDSKRLSERTGFRSVFPDLGDTKDFSDYYKALQDKNDFKKLKLLFN